MGLPTGFFIAEITIDWGRGFLAQDLDELAYLVCSIAKEKLGHTHDFHRHSIRRKEKHLHPSAVLVVPPVHLAGTRWKKRIEECKLSSEDLREARPQRTVEMPPGEHSRSALVCLRYGYLKAAEHVSQVLWLDYTHELSWHRGRGTILGLLFWSGVSAFMFLSLLVGLPAPFNVSSALPAAIATSLAAIPTSLAAIPMSFAIITMWYFETLTAIFRPPVDQNVILATLLTTPFGAFVGYNALRFLRWDHPRLRLLRAATGFFQAAQPLNRLIERTKLPQCSHSTDDFSAALAVFDVKTQMNAHQAATHQLWMTLSLAIVAIVLAALAL